MGKYNTKILGKKLSHEKERKKALIVQSEKS